MKLTTEQQRVVNSRARLLAVDAFAGTGKTSTLVAYAAARPNKRILYVAFNKSVAEEAKERFPAHVACRTTHSLAYAAEGRQFHNKLGNPKPRDVATELECPVGAARHALISVQTWLSSADPELTLQHVDAELQDPVKRITVLDLAQKLWEKMRSLHSPVEMPHDGYLKLWALTKPKLHYDILLLDEAQDTNPLVLDLVMSQQAHASIVLVGDRHQGIYSFRGAINAMETVNAEERIAITQSFRFGQGIADVATRLLQVFKQESQFVQGRQDIAVSWEVNRRRPYAVIGRTNACLFAELADHVSHDSQRLAVHYVGGFNSYFFGKVLDTFYLWSDQTSQITDTAILKFPSFEEFETYGKESQDPEILSLVKVVNKYGRQIPRIYAALKAAEVTADRARIIISTAHKSKGLEFEQVVLTDDFADLQAEEPPKDEEINLLYVALTRATRAVSLPADLQSWIKQHEGQPTPPVTDAPVELVNLTGEPLALRQGDGNDRLLPSAGAALIQRQSSTPLEVCGPVPMGRIQLVIPTLPPAVPSRIFVVPEDVCRHFHHRTDLVYPDELLAGHDDAIPCYARLMQVIAH